MTQYFHFSAKPLLKVHSKKQTHGRAEEGDKPNGLWFSVDGEDGWRSWCEAEGFGLNHLKCQTEVIFKPDARLLTVAGADEIDAFNLEYGITPKWSQGLATRHRAIDWRRVASKHDAILIAPYCWERRLSDIRWYYSWDCASGCVWNADAVQELRPVELSKAA